MDIRTVVLGFDFSDPSRETAAWTARHFAPGARFLIVHAISVPEPPRFLKGRFPLPEELIANARRGAHERLREVATALRLDKVDLIVREGEPAEQIQAVAVEESADVVVVGPHHDRPGVWRLIGGTAQRIARRSSVPVLIARGLPDGPPRHILTPLDDSEATDPVLRAAVALARRFGARLTLLHVIADALMGAVRVAATEAEARDASANLVRSAEDWLSERASAAGLSRGKVELEVRAGDAAHQILDASTVSGADLIVIGRSGAGRVGELILGSVANSVLRNGTGPTLIVGNEPT